MFPSEKISFCVIFRQVRASAGKRLDHVFTQAALSFGFCKNNASSEQKNAARKSLFVKTFRPRALISHFDVHSPDHS
jgi:hypothetical protein